MKEITISGEVTLQEYYSGLDVLPYGKGVRITLWAILAIGAASLASSAALTWGTSASILAGLALSVYIFCLYWSRRIYATQRRQAYERYRESSTSYTFTNERILATSRYVQSSFAWAGVDRAMEIRTVYLLAVGNRYIIVPKRNIPPDNFEDFIQLLRAHHLLEQP